jgi:hypothetical protein
MALLPQLSVASIVYSHGLHNSKMGQRNVLGAAGTTEDVSTVPTVVFPVGKGELLPTSHANIGVGPFGWSGAVEHAAGDLLPGREVEPFELKRSIAFGEIVQTVLSLCANSPNLYEFENLASHLDVAAIRCFQQANQVVHKLPASDLLHKVAASVLDASVGEIEGSKLNVRILVAYAAFQTAHGLLRLHRFATDDV